MSTIWLLPFQIIINSILRYTHQKNYWHSIDQILSPWAQKSLEISDIRLCKLSFNNRHYLQNVLKHLKAFMVDNSWNRIKLINLFFFNQSEIQYGCYSSASFNDRRMNDNLFCVIKIKIFLYDNYRSVITLYNQIW